MVQGKRRLIFGIYCTNIGNETKVEACSWSSKDEVPVIAEALQAWLQGAMKTEAGEIEQGHPLLVQEFRKMHVWLKKLPGEEAERVMQDAANMLEGIRKGR